MRMADRLAYGFFAALAAAVVVLNVSPADAEEGESPAVNYISADAVYLNIGKYAGLKIGARVAVVRSNRTIAVLEVVHVSSHSASCRVVKQTEPPRVGDAVQFDPQFDPLRSAISPSDTTTISAAAAARPPANVVSGYVALQTVWQQDLTGSEISSLQPAVSARVLVGNVGGTGAVFRFRDRLRYYYRDQPPGQTLAKDQWMRRLTELALTFDRPEATIEWGVGRLITPYTIGIGQIDGGYAAFKLHRYFRAGLAGGFEPNPIDMSLDGDRQLATGFVAFDYDKPQSWQFASSAALAGRYVSGNVNRDFVYIQNSFSLRHRLSLFQSAEIDLNRDWRRDAVGESATLSNFYFIANAELSRYALVNFTYDTRKNVRNYDTMSVPDSLFDDGVYDGFGGSLMLRLPRGFTVGGRGGIRYRDDDRTNRYYSLYANATRLPWSGHSVSLRYAFAETRLTTGYRPMLAYRFPASRRLRLNVNAGGYIYDLGRRRSSSFYGEMGARYTMGKYFTSGSYRQYFGDNLDSILMFAEVGLNL
jgi:hypothetical protein